jgi:hypothetical protein
MPNTGVLDSDLPVGTSGIHPALDMPNRVAEGFFRHLTEWYAFVFYTFSLLMVAYMLVPSLLTKEKPKSDAACRRLTRRVVETATLIRRENSTARLDLAERGPIARRLGGKVPVCPDGGHVQFLPTGSTAMVDGVPTVVTSAYLAGICVRPNGERCFEGAILARIHPTEAYLDGVLRPDSPNIPWTPPRPVKKVEKAKPKKKMMKRTTAAGITILK